MGYKKYLSCLFSLCYDAFIVLALFFAFTALCLFIRDGQVIPPGSLWYQLSLLILCLSYFFLSIKYGGQTIGMRAWRLKIISRNENGLTSSEMLQSLILIIPAALLTAFQLKKAARWLKQWHHTRLVQIVP